MPDEFIESKIQELVKQKDWRRLKEIRKRMSSSFSVYCINNKQPVYLVRLSPINKWHFFRK
jgi:hypothetical protein